MLRVDASRKTHVQVGKCCHRLAAGCYCSRRGKCGIVKNNNVPFYVVDFVCILAFLTIFFIRLILQYLNSIPTSSLILTRFGHREQLSHLVLSRKKQARSSTVLECEGATMHACIERVALFKYYSTLSNQYVLKG